MCVNSRLKPFRSQVNQKHFIGREFQSLAVQGKKLLAYTSSVQPLQGMELQEKEAQKQKD